MSDWRGTRVLVTGGSSFIGAGLVKRLAREGARIRVLTRKPALAARLKDVEGDLTVEKGDLRLAADASRAVRDTEVLFHLAAGPGSRAFVEKYPSQVWENLTLDVHLARAAADAGVSRVVFASSATVYPQMLRKSGEPMAEEKVGPPFDPDSAFGWAKLTAEKILRDIHDEKKIRVAVCRLFSVYGETAPTDNVVQSWAVQALSANPRIELWGGGRQKRSWLHVDDVVTGLLAASKATEGFLTVNLGGSPAISVAEMAGLVLSAVGSNAKPILQPGVDLGTAHQVADISKALSLGWKPLVSAEEGTRRVVERTAKR